MRSIRHLVAPAALLAASLLACNDITTPNPSATATSANLSSLTLEQYIDQQIGLLYDRGFATSVQARWSTIKSKKPTNFAVAQKDFANLADWIDKKESSLRPPAGEGKEAAAVRLTLNMSNWLYGTGDTDPVADVGEDVTVEVIPQGEPAEVVVPSEHAGVAFGPQNEPRVVIISESEYPGHCNGPLVTSRCQYPLFYRISIQPDVKIIGHGRFAVCIRTDTDRRPLDYPADEPSGPVHERLRLAHELPADPANYTDGATREEGIEILERAPTQQGFTHCDEHSHVGMNRIEKALHAAMHFAGRVVSPKDAYAYDQGPEHFADFASNFNAVDPDSKPDVAVASVSGAPAEAWEGDAVTVTYTVENRSRRMGGHATAMSRATTAQIKLFDAEGNAVATLGAVDNVLAMRPDADPQSFTQAITLPTDIALDRSYYLGAVVGDAGLFSEVGLANNTGKAAAATLVKKKKPDLQFVSGFTLSPAEVAPGGTVTTSAWTVRNDGNAGSGLFNGSFYLVPAEGAAVALLSGIAHETLAAGGEAEHAGVTLTIPSGTAPGSYTVELRLDTPLEELDENDNSASTALTVENPPVGKITAVGDIAPPTTTLTFVGVPFNTVLTTQYSSSGVTFSPGGFVQSPQGGGYPGIDNNNVGNFGPGVGCPGPRSIFFNPAVGAAGFNIVTNDPDQLHLTAKKGGVTLGAGTFNTGTGFLTFAGFAAAGGIDELVIEITPDPGSFGSNLCMLLDNLVMGSGTLASGATADMSIRASSNKVMLSNNLVKVPMIGPSEPAALLDADGKPKPQQPSAVKPKP